MQHENDENENVFNNNIHIFLYLYQCFNFVELNVLGKLIAIVMLL